MGQILKPFLPEISPYHLGYIHCNENPPQRVKSGLYVFEYGLTFETKAANESFEQGRLDCLMDRLTIVKERKTI